MLLPVYMLLLQFLASAFSLLGYSKYALFFLFVDYVNLFPQYPKTLKLL